MTTGNPEISSGYFQLIILAVLSFFEVDQSHLESDQFPLKMFVTSIYKTRPRGRARSGDICMVLID